MQPTTALRTGTKSVRATRTICAAGVVVRRQARSKSEIGAPTNGEKAPPVSRVFGRDGVYSDADEAHIEPFKGTKSIRLIATAAAAGNSDNLPAASRTPNLDGGEFRNSSFSRTISKRGTRPPAVRIPRVEKPCKSVHEPLNTRSTTDRTQVNNVKKKTTNAGTLCTQFL